ncbi:MAG: endolytic transglycosylase MltG [bacterium]|nr:endolytic transglycosylase MltG [bacterium]
MFNDVQPPKRPLGSENNGPAPGPGGGNSFQSQNLPPVNQEPRRTYSPMDPLPAGAWKRNPWYRRPTPLTSLIIGFVLVFGFGSAALWYLLSLQPVSGDASADKVQVYIRTGSTPDQIASKLVDEKVIRSEMAFNIYTRLNKVRDSLQAGVYVLSPNSATPDIVSRIAGGDVDHFNISFLPGKTLKETKKALMSAGFGAKEIDDAFAKDYESPLFKSKPAGTSLEGYIYGGTYTFDGQPSVEDILQATFAQFWGDIQKNKLEAGFKKQGLNLYQGITLASIVQKEVHIAKDQKGVARVFYNRLDEDMKLGSDVTFMYAAQLLGEEASPNIDSPYNTRIHKGLPPGPIAVPSPTALQAVAKPAKNDYLFFLSGDNGKTYYAYTNYQHETNISEHCKISCAPQ